MAAVIPMFAAPAGAANSCDAGQYPASYAAQSGLKVFCLADAGTNLNHIEIHDAPNVNWHHGAARTVLLDPAAGNATNAGNATINFAGTVLSTPNDLRRPISAFDAVTKATIFPGGTFIIAVAGTTATLSQPATLTELTVPALRVEHTNNRTIIDAKCTAVTPNTTVTLATTTVRVSSAPAALSNATVGTASNAVDVATFVGGQTLTVAAATGAGFTSPTGTLHVATSHPQGATLTYTGHTAGALTFTGVDTTAGTGFLATGGAVSKDVTQLGTTLNIATTTPATSGFTSPSGTLHLATSSTTGAKVSYTGHVANSLTFTGLTLLSGTGGIGVGAVSRDVDSFTGAQTLDVVASANFPTAGTVNVATSPNGFAVMTYTGKSGVTPNFKLTGVTKTSGAGGIGANSVALNVNSFVGAQTLNVASTTAANYVGGPTFTTPTGTLHVVTDSPAGATLTYTGTTGTTFTGVTKTVGTGGLANGSAVTQGATANVHLTSATAKFVLADEGKSVAGASLGANARIITFVSLTDVILNAAPTRDCTTNNGGAPTAGPGGTHPVVPLTGVDKITIGGDTYSGATPQMFNSDPMNVMLANTAVGGQAFSCSGSVLTMLTPAVDDTGGFAPTAASKELAVSVKGTTTVASKIVSVAGNAATLSVACPAGITKIAGSATIGVFGATAPVNSAPMMTLGAELNLNPALVASSGDCANATTSGFMVVGGWINPSNTLYAASTSTPPASVAQVLFPTSVISFNGFVVPKRSGDTVMPGVPHYNFSFAVLPTSLAVCLDDTPANNGVPTDPTGLTFGMNPTTQSAAPFLPTFGGNPGDPTVRDLLPISSGSSFRQTIELIENPSAFTNGGVISTFPGTLCATNDPTDPPDTHCGDG